MSTVVGALAVELGLDTAQFERSLKSLPGMTQTHFNSMSAEMKRTSKEGAESLRLIDEAFGIHISRPIARILTQEFPGLAKGLSSLLGAGVALGVAGAAFDFIVKGVERVTKAMEDAKRKEQELEDATRHLHDTLENTALSHIQRMAQYQAQLDELSGDKAGALGQNLKVASIEDADRAISELNAITEAMLKEAKAAQEAEAWTTRFWLAVAGESTHSVEGTAKEFQKLADQLADASRYDALHQTSTGIDLAKKKVAEFDAQLKQMQANRISGARAFLDDVITADIYPIKSGNTDKEIEMMSRLDKLAKSDLETLQAQSAEHAKHAETIRKQSEAKPDVGEKELEKLKASTDAELALAAATAKGTTELKLAQAAGEADQIISRILTEAHGRLTKQIQEELASVHALTAERLVAKDAVALNQELLKETEGYDRQIEAIRNLSSAYAAGGSAIASALIEKQLEADKQKIADYTKEFQKLQAEADQYAAGKASLAGAPGPVQGLGGVDPKALDTLKAKIDEANASLQKHREQLEAIRAENYTLEINKEGDALRVEQPLLDRLNQAYTENAESVRKAQVALALFHWEQAHPGATPDQIQAVTVQLEQQSINQQRAADAQLASRYLIGKSYDDEIAKLERAREVIQGYGGDTLAIDAAIYDERNKMLKQWDDAAFKVGTFQEKFQATMNEVILKGQEAAQKMAQSWATAIDGINSSMAKLLTGQKTDFGKVVLQLAQEQTKGELEKAEASIASRYEISLPGLGAKNKPDGSSGNPLHVAIVSDQTGRSAGTRSQTSPAGGGGTPGGAISEIPSTASDFFKAIVPIFGGFLEAGGPAKSGTTYVVGENGPELFTANANGRIVPNSKLSNQDFTFGPGDRDYGSYVNYVHWLEKTRGSQSGLSKGLGALLGFGVSFALKGLDDLIKPHPSRGSIAAGMPAKSGSLADLNALTDSAGIAGAMAEGGDVFSGNTYLVGERGPEMFRAPSSSSTTNNRTGDVHNHNTINFNGKGDPVDLFRRTSKHELDRTFARIKT